MISVSSRVSVVVMPAVLAALTLSGLAHAQTGDSGSIPSGTSGAAIRPAEPAKDVAKKPVIVLPEIVHFEHADYPPEAEKQGLQADVNLKLTLDRDGNVTKAEVTTPVGNGFDEAAQAAAMKFKFTPATRDGVPVPVVIPYRYSFTLTPKEPEAAPPAAPTTGNLGGTVRLADSNAPLAGALVTITLPDGTTQQFTTDEAGKWQAKDVPAGHYKVHIEAPGFVFVENAEDVVAGEETDATYRLAPASTGIEITVQGERPPREVTRRTIERREIERIPGTSGDALRSLQSLPGVGRPPGLAGLLIVRGSAPQDTQVYVDGTLVPLIYHFGGLSSVVPTELLDKIDFYPGNFSSRYGRVDGGIVEVGLRSPDTNCTGDYGVPIEGKKGCFHGMAQMDLIDGRLMLQGPLPAKDWTFAVAGRRSWIDVWLKPVLEGAGSSVTAAPVYYDYQAIIDHKNASGRFSARFFGSDDKFKIIVTDPAAQDPAFGGTLSFGTSFYRGQVLYETDLSHSVSSTSMVSFGRDSVGFAVGNFEFDLDTWNVYARHEFGFKVARGVKLNAGLDFVIAPYEVTARFPPPPRPGEPDPGPFASRPPQQTHEDATVFRPAWYGEGEIQATDRLRLVPGLRIDYSRDTGHADVAPRGVARYDLVKGTDPDHPENKRLRTTLKAGAGLFYQPPQFQETNAVFGTPGLYSNKSVHYDIGVEQEFSEHVELSLEGFYKALTNQVARSPNAAGQFTYDNLGSGSVIGLEALLKYKPDKRFFGWIAYTLSRSVRRDCPSCPEYLFQYDQTHNLIILGSYRLGRGWEFGARFRIVSGNLDTPVQSAPALPALYASDAGAYTALQASPYSTRLPLFHQLDMRVDKRWQFRTWRFSTYLDIQNVYNNAAVEGLSYNYNFSKQSYQTGIPIIPSIGLRGEF
ncbi:MAG TPA: TonB-dependent receptor [Polyangiaceae bacterium]|jgi:TonB family protein|nr:TonB-dependent receptor [Polyangiaceae bacterium]